jgi:hypothetical protein
LCLVPALNLDHQKFKKFKMKKFESLGRQLSREEQKAINGGFFNVYNVVARCSPSNSVVAGCGANCQDAYAQCDSGVLWAMYI